MNGNPYISSTRRDRLLPILERDRRVRTSWAFATYASLLFLGAIIVGAIR